MKKSNLYTATGDKGTTSLVGGKRIQKDDVRIEAYGAIDELNSHLGLIGSFVTACDETVYRQILTVQHRLFDIGAALATYTQCGETAPEGVSENAVLQLESWIDMIDAELPALRNFILPGGTIASSHAQIARTVCRRAERRIVTLNDISTVSPSILRYVNRLSDYLFALARRLNVQSSTPETIWVKEI